MVVKTRQTLRARLSKAACLGLVIGLTLTGCLVFGALVGGCGGSRGGSADKPAVLQVSVALKPVTPTGSERGFTLQDVDGKAHLPAKSAR